mmetsp:Transcript_40499/g.114714  ORF Transcript_40499/g.114714 Transcript_40499/m.114714 type:complete len:214 (-) Transcript_40499:581-1222(-)
MMSQGRALIYSSAVATSPFRISRCLIDPSSFSTKLFIGLSITTFPPRASMYSTMGAHKRSGWFPSRKAICNPSVSLRKRLRAVRTTVMDNLSGSMKSSALAMATNTSSLMRSGMPYFLMNSVTDSSSWASINGCPSKSIGMRGGAVCIFSSRVSIFWLLRIAAAKLNGAGTPGGKSKVVNSPGSPCMANTILCIFHCRRSSMSSSAKRFIMLG